MSDSIPKEQAVRDVRILAERLALLYRCFCEGIEKELGKEKAKTFVRQVVEDYGARCGKDVRQTVNRLGLPLTAQNYALGHDLPSVGWEMEPLPTEESGSRVQINYCPLAEKWKAMGQAEYDRIYCYVDQAKYGAYNPELECLHVQNCLDGDGACEILVHRRAKG